MSKEVEQFIIDKFKNKYDVFRAEDKQESRTILQSIFHEISESEYLLFIDFNNGDNRGSLFSNQELAIACFLEIPFLALIQEGVARDGILKYIKSPFVPFTFNNEKKLYELIQQQLDKWESNWKNTLILERKENEKSPHFRHAGLIALDRDGHPFNPLCSFYHVQVQNLHNRKIATNCYGYINSILDYTTKKPIFAEPLKTIELKWAGFTLPNATILPNKQSRLLDVFFVREDEVPPSIYFNTLTDSTEYRFLIQQEGTYEISILVISDNFQPIRKTFYLYKGSTIEEIIFTSDEKTVKELIRSKMQTIPTPNLKDCHISGQ